MKEYTLNECFDLIRNGASIKQFKASGIPITRIETISSGIIDYSKVGYADIFDDKYSDFYLKENDILMSHINSEKHLGKVAIVKGINQKIIHGMNLLILRYKKDIIYPKYIYYYFKTNKFKLNIFKISKKSVNQASFNVSELKKIRVFLPNTRKQQEISEKLDKVTEIIKKQKEQLELLENLKKSQFFELFGDPIKNEKGWKIKRLENVLEINNKRKLLDSKKEYWLLNLEDIEQDSGRVILKKKVNYEKLPSSISYFDKNWVLYSKLRPYLNKVVLSDEEGFCTSELLALKPDTKYITEIFLWKYLMNSSVLKYLETHVSGAKMPRVVMNDFKSLKIILPPLELQNKFATKIEAIQKLKFEIEKSLKETENLYNSLMQKFFSNK